MTADTRRLLDGPIVPTLLRLAAPNVVVMAVQAVVNAGEALYVGWLGADALAGVALVFPLIMLMQTMSAGGMGGGIASAVARALGGGRRAEANALAWHAVVIALGMGALFSALMLATGPRLYAALGGQGPVLGVAVAYSSVVFGGAIAFWLFNSLASVVRGTGNMALPAAVVVGGAVVVLTVSPALILGVGPLPRLGVAGAAVALVTYYVLGALVLIGYLVAGHGLVRLALGDLRLRAALFREILRVGAPGALNTIQANLTVVLLTGLVGPFGGLALAGYGVAARLEYLQIPLVFGLGSALVTMVGTNVGAGQAARARRVTWIGAGMAAALTAAIGMAATLAPDAWLTLFTRDAGVLATGRAYLRTVGPAYGFFGLGLGLYFASQGTGSITWPLVGGFARLLVAAGAGWFVVRRLDGGLPGLFAVIAASLAVFGLTVAVALALRGARRARLVMKEART
ncbi:MAG TPA: MATE family efflux transporter [Methylomirabilota bacterium]|nr:MATE family efflux transporter [Methylomirabilota bacterium]